LTMKKMIWVMGITLLMSNSLLSQSSFVQVDGTHFTLEGKPYQYIGTNFWYGMNLGAGSQQDRDRLTSELDKLKQLGISNLRIMAASEGPEDSPYQNKPILQTAPGTYNEDLLKGLDFLLVEMNKRNMKGVVCLGNFWMWSGGFPQYISWADNSDIPYPDVLGGSSWDDFIGYSESFYGNRKAIHLYYDFLKFIINRKNSISGIDYKNDPTIMAWQLANEPRGYHHVREYRKWIKRTARLIQKEDKNHLVCLGAEGDTSTKQSGTDLYEDSKTKHLDYATTHLWIQNWGWFDPEDTSTYKKAQALAQSYLDGQLEKGEKLGKPLVLEEFGVSRDGGEFEDGTATSFRDRFYDFIFDYCIQNMHSGPVLQGCNFWSWGGTGRPANPGGLWEIGNDLIGDPAHELQGWYSVYDNDTSTINIIKKYTSEVN